MTPSRREAIDDCAVTPIVAVVLLLAITVTLAGVMWVTFSSITPPQQNPVYIGCSVHLVGGNWSIDIVSVEPRPSTGVIGFVVLDPEGNISLPSTPLSVLPEFHDSEPFGILNPGDFVWLPASTYPMGSTIMFTNEYQVMFSRMLWG
jgi:flagellin-like protein